MQKLNKKQLLNVTGGSISSTLLNAVVRGVNVFLEVGRSVGSAIRRFLSGQKCSI